MLIQEGVVKITSREEHALNSFVHDLLLFYNGIKEKTTYSILDDINKYTNEILAPKYRLNYFKWEFVYDNKTKINALYKSLDKLLIINLAKFVPRPSLSLTTQEVDFDHLIETLYHEYVHVKQMQLVNPTEKDIEWVRRMYKKLEYLNIPWEQMAHAKNELQWIKNKLKVVDPNQVIKVLKNMGLTNPRFQLLKYSNYDAYKKILRYAILFVMDKMEKTGIDKKPNLP